MLAKKVVTRISSSHQFSIYFYFHRNRYLLQNFNNNLLSRLFDGGIQDRKSTRLNSSHVAISYAVFCLKKKNGDGEKRRPAQLSAQQAPQHTDFARHRK